MDNQIPKKKERGHLRLLELKKRWKFLKETDRLADRISNVKFIIQFARIIKNVKFNQY